MDRLFSPHQYEYKYEGELIEQDLYKEVFKLAGPGTSVSLDVRPEGIFIGLSFLTEFPGLTLINAPVIPE